MKRRVAIFIFLLFATSFAHAQNMLSNVRSWLCFYGNSFPSKEMNKYDLYVLDRTDHPDIAPLKKQGSHVIGYVSAGEISKNDPHFKEIPRNILIEENKQWDSHRVNIKNKKWHDFILNRVVPEAISHGFDGIFVDTIDVAFYLENEKKMAGQIEGAVDLIGKIRKKYPGIVIVQNGGLFLSDRVGESIDALAVEDIYTLYDFENKKYLTANEQWTKERLVPVKAFQEKFAKPVLSLDYVEPSDRKKMELVAHKAESEGFIPYIADIGLKKIFFHP